MFRDRQLDMRAAITLHWFHEPYWCHFILLMEEIPHLFVVWFYLALDLIIGMFSDEMSDVNGVNGGNPGC